MQATTKPFLTLTAGDLMTAPVLTIPQETPLREAARLLSRSSISGAPVVDGDGRCLGVLSSSDFVTWAGTKGEAEAKGERISFLAPWGEIIDINDSPDSEVRRFMTAQPVTVAPTARVGELAQKMVDAHIHRVLVVVEGGRPCGIVTSTDVLAAVARTAQQAAQESKGPRRRARQRR
jgi:CBS domain-containing protein